MRYLNLAAAIGFAFFLASDIERHQSASTLAADAVFAVVNTALVVIALRRKASGTHAAAGKSEKADH